MNSSEIFGAIKRGFASLVVFAGRDRRGQFWPYAIALFLAVNALSVIVMVPVIINLLFGSFATAERLSAENPQDWVVERGPASLRYQYIGDDPAVRQALFPDFGLLFIGIAGIAALFIGLMAAAVCRRLHDRGISGWWLMAPVALLVISYWQMFDLFSAMTRMTELQRQDADAIMGHIFPIVGLNMLYLVALLLLVIQLALPGQPGENRYGLPPD